MGRKERANVSEKGNRNQEDRESSGEEYRVRVEGRERQSQVGLGLVSN